MSRDASELARRLARDAEAVCRHYLSNGRRQGRYWTVGDVRNTPGRSMFVRLSGPDYGPGAAGHWTDAASAEHGDLLDVIRESCGLVDFRDVAEEARRFLRCPAPNRGRRQARSPAPPDRPKRRAAVRHVAADPPARSSRPTCAIAASRLSTDCGRAAVSSALLLSRPRRPFGRAETWPAMIAAVTDLADGAITGAHRTWLAPDGFGKAPVDTPRRAMGGLLGHAVRFGAADDVLAVGEGIETILSLRCALPAMPMAAALSANHLAALLLPPTLRRLYIARDADAAGDAALAALTERADAAGIEALALSPRTGDFNEDLRAFGLGALRAALRIQLAPQDVVRFMLFAGAGAV